MVAMTTNLVARLGDLLNQRRMLIGDPPQDEKSSSRAVLLQKLQEEVGAYVNPWSEIRPAPCATGNLGGMEVIFQVDTENVEHRRRGLRRERHFRRSFGLREIARLGSAHPFEKNHCRL
jgi:hypothetical protein